MKKGTKLYEVLHLHPEAKVKSQSWAAAVIEDVYTEIEAKARRSDVILLPLSGMTMLEIIYNHFIRKFGTQMAEEYLANFNNTILHFKVGEVFLVDSQD